jgi:hypothetical protein
MRKLLLFGLIATAAVLAVASPERASGAKDPGILKTGKCSGASTWKLKAKREDAGIEAEFEVDQNRVGRRWSVVMRRNGAVVFRGVRRTVAPSGSFEVRRILSGRGRITATARALATGETCRASLTI